MAAHRPDVIISAGRPGLSQQQTALLRIAGVRHVILAQGPGRWADQARRATDVATSVELTGARPAGSSWLASWQRADAAALRAVDAILDEDHVLTEPRLARDLLRMMPQGSLLWVGSSMPIRDVDVTMAPRGDIRLLSSRGASGIDGTTSSAIGAALASQGGGPGQPAGGPAFALLGDLTFVHDAAGLAIGPGEPRPDICLIVVNNDGGGIFSTLEPAGFPGPFERVFGTPHGADLAQLAGAFGIPHVRADDCDDLAKVLSQTVPGAGVRVVEVGTDREAGAALRARIREAAVRAVATAGA
jgi:2-succinyl-5-enolpyruvyl-6-hydroxy-3-cyclohexene-1-carboxylate synthase